MVDKLGTELSDSSQRVLSERRPEKTCRKKTLVGKNLGRKSGGIRGLCSGKPTLRRLHDWKVTAHYYKACIPRKHGKLE